MRVNHWTIPIDVFKVAGDQAEWYLDGQLSVSVSALEQGSLRTGLLLNPDGTLVAPVGVAKDDDCIYLYSPRGSSVAVVERLMRFKLRSKVSFEPSSGSAVGLYGLTKDEIENSVNDLQSDSSGLVCGESVQVGDIYFVELFHRMSVDVHHDSDLRLSGEEEGIARSIAGQPCWGAEIVAGMNPMDLGSSYVRSHADFAKGCYTGQELIERVDSRGYNTPRRLSGFIVRGNVEDSLNEGNRIVEHEGKRVFSISSLFSYPEANCQIGLGFVHRIGGKFLTRHVADTVEFTVVEPGSVLSGLKEN